MNTNKQTKEPTAHDFLAWLKEQPADWEIDHTNWGTCAVGQFLATHGYKYPSKTAGIHYSWWCRSINKGESDHQIDRIIEGATYGETAKALETRLKAQQ